MYDHIGALALIVVAVIVTAWSIHREVTGRRLARAAAMRRHPSGRTPDFTSERARKYHESNQLGRN